MLAPNTTLQGRYRIVRQLGRGGMGTVYEARALRLNTTVALKETHFTDERLRRQFEREAQLLANLRHPALPRVIDHFDESDGLYLVMDFVEGDDLWEMLKKRGEPFAVADVVRWAEQLLDALQYLHTQSPPVIHRDIKPQNLKLAGDGRLILLDFGLAKGMSGDAASGLMTSRTVMGFSLPYAPLEQILQIDEGMREQLSVLNPQEVERLRRSGTDHRSDLYSAGATLLHLLTAKVPTHSPTRAVSVWSNQADPLANTLSQSIPENLWAFFDHSMALDPDRRFPSAASMRAALHTTPEAAPRVANFMPTVLDSAPGRDTRPSKDSRDAHPTPNAPPGSSTRPSRRTDGPREKAGGRGRLLASAVVVAAVLAASVFALLYFNRTDDKPPVANTNPPAQQTPTPDAQPSPAPTPEVAETPPNRNASAPVNTPPVNAPPVNNAPDANRRAAPVPTPPRPAVPTPTPRPTPQPEEDEPAGPRAGAGRELREINREIRQLERRRVMLVLGRGPASPEVERIDRRIADLKQRREALRAQ